MDNEDFQSALMDSLRNNGLLAEGNAPRYILYAHLLDVHQPLVGLNMTVTAKVNYELADAVNGQPTRGNDDRDGIHLAVRGCLRGG